VDQRGRLQGVARSFVFEVRSGDASQTRIDEKYQLGIGGLVSQLQFGQKLGDRV
jgi:hypothetical protein